MARRSPGTDPLEDRDALYAAARAWADFDPLCLYDKRGTPLSLDKIPRLFRIFVQPKGPVTTRQVWDGKKQIAAATTHPGWVLNTQWGQFRQIGEKIVRSLEKEEKRAPKGPVEQKAGPDVGSLMQALLNMPGMKEQLVEALGGKP